MRRLSQGIVLLEVGATAAHLSTFGGYLRFLRPEFRLPMMAAGLTFLILGFWTLCPVLVAYIDAAAGEPGPTDSRQHDQGSEDVTGASSGDHRPHDGRGPGVGWLLAAPLVTLLLVSPPSLGADAARHDLGRSAAAGSDIDFPPLPAPTSGAVDMPLSTFVFRATYDRELALAAVDVRLTGFVVHDPAITDGYLLTRFSLVCCAADAYATQVEVRHRSPVPPEDSWVTVEGEWVAPTPGAPIAAETTPIVLAESQTVIDAPDDPYE